ncbi:MAG: putative inorganic polyphosphate/ATP-NAD kinase [bacterium ADurb.Bin429]|nr:MAG: putative inorganic polyphosphate/ATP-NAD kinase [bacterium ADurb.Bin429]
MKAERRWLDHSLPPVYNAPMQIAMIATMNRPHAVEIVRRTVHWLRAHGHAARMTAALAEAADCPELGVPENAVMAGADLALSIGGDGTMLGTASLAAPHQVPVLGVNAGALGFLTELTPNELPQYLPRVLAGDYTLEPRMLLRAQLRRDDAVVAESTALNDIVVRQGITSRMINLEVRVAGHRLGRFGADGLIVSTPTGSTAYCLSAGGPIVHPGASVMVLVPICPHSLSFRPMVIPATDPVEILCESNSHGDEMMVTTDGHQPVTANPGDRVTIAVAAEHALLVKLGLFSFYDRLREKLQWGGNRG